MDERLRAVEAALVEIATTTKLMRALVAIVALSLGHDLTGIAL